MKALPLALTMAAFALPAKAMETPVWKAMDNDELNAFAETIVQNTGISAELAFGKTGDLEKSRLRVRTYPRGDKELLVVESAAAENGNPEKEVIWSVQLKRVKDDGSVELLWEVLRRQPTPAPTRLPAAKGLQWDIAPQAPGRHGPTDTPEEKLFRSVS